MFCHTSPTSRSPGTAATIFFSVAFWLWLARDIVAQLLEKHALASGSYLLIVTATVFGAVVLARLSAGPAAADDLPVAAGRRLLEWCVLSIAVIGLSILVSGATAFALFKLTNYALNVAVALVLAFYLVSYRVYASEFFMASGFAIALAGYSILGDLAQADECIGLRALPIAHLNIQDFYALLWLFSFSGLCLAPSRVSRIAGFLFASAICLPVMVLMNSRMLPLTIGVSAAAIVAGSRNLGLTGRRLVRAVLAALAILAFAHEIRNVNPDSRMATVYSDGIVGAFRNDPRYESFRESLYNYLDNPWLGIGFGRFTFPGTRLDPYDRLAGTWPHNIFLELASEMGTVGLFVFAIPLLTTVSQMLRRVWQGTLDHSMYPSVCLVYAFATVQLSHNLWHAQLWMGFAWTFMALHTERSPAVSGYEIEGRRIEGPVLPAPRRRSAAAALPSS